MTLRFAAARSARSPLSRTLARKLCARAANDNGAAGGSDDLMLHAALRHFAAHGVGAARLARREAEQAFFAGDRQTYDWWLGVCRTLDERLAAQLVHKTGRERRERVPDIAG